MAQQLHKSSLKMTARTHLKLLYLHLVRYQLILVDTHLSNLVQTTVCEILRENTCC